MASNKENDEAKTKISLQETNRKPLEMELDPRGRISTGSRTENQNGRRNHSRESSYEVPEDSFAEEQNQRHPPKMAVAQQQVQFANLDGNLVPLIEYGGAFYNLCNFVQLPAHQNTDFSNDYSLNQLTLLEKIKNQTKYYFSVKNLLYDRFLRSMMNEDGYVDIALIANFPKIRNLTSDLNVIIEALKCSRKLELSHDGKVRCAANPLSWILDGNSVEEIDTYSGRVKILPNIMMEQ